VAILYDFRPKIQTVGGVVEQLVSWANGEIVKIQEEREKLCFEGKSMRNEDRLLELRTRETVFRQMLRRIGEQARNLIEATRHA